MSGAVHGQRPQYSVGTCIHTFEPQQLAEDVKVGFTSLQLHDIISLTSVLQVSSCMNFSYDSFLFMTRQAINSRILSKYSLD